MEKYTPQLEKPKPSSLADVSAIEEGRNQLITERADLERLVEQPLLEACEELYDKNIRTLSTSANKKDIESGEAYIIVAFDTLSEENKEIARRFAEPIEYDGGLAVKIIIPVDESTTSEQISEEAKKISSAFQKQAATWIKGYTLEYLKKAYGMSDEDTQFDDPSAWEGYYYDPESKLFYTNEEMFRKANEKI